MGISSEAKKKYWDEVRAGTRPRPNVGRPKKVTVAPTVAPTQ